MKCPWADGDNAAMTAYHDHEWGFVTTDETATFELMVLEMMQAGLSWQTVLNKRAAFKTAFANYDLTEIADFKQPEIDTLMANAGIIRNKRKILATINNAQLLQKWHSAGQTLIAYLWSFVDYEPQNSQLRSMTDLPAQTDLSKRISKTLKKQGFQFLGPTIVYSWLQALGIINDHLTTCDRYEPAIAFGNAHHDALMALKKTL